METTAVDYRGTDANENSSLAMQDFFAEIFEPSVLLQFNEDVLNQIPILKAMGLSFSEYSSGMLKVDMPLAPNINDKNTGFGGSIVTLATICGWALLTLLLNKDKKRFDVIIAESTIRYQSPVTTECYSAAKLSDGQILKLLRDLVTTGKSRVDIEIKVHEKGNHDKHAASFAGQYYIRPIKTQPSNVSQH